jgi:hypothetical protein
MGSYGVYRPSGMTDKDFFQEEFPSVTVLDAARVESVCYVKMQTRKGDVFMFVSPFCQRDGEFIYKDQTEEMGPIDVKCPLRMLEGLTDPVNEYSAKWRQEVRDYHARKRPLPKVGQRIRLATPLKFTNGDLVQEFEVVRYKKTGIAYRADYKTYKISNIREREFEILA